MKSFKKIVACILCFTIMIASCGCQLKSTKEEPLKSFDAFITEMFQKEVSADTISLHYCISNPENYGIKEPEASLGEYSVTHMNEEISKAENYLSTLKRYDPAELTEEEKLIYDILMITLENTIKTGDYLYYQETLGPTTGVQAQLPILLAEYSFYKESDITTYLNLLGSIGTYFEQISEFEREKSEKGFFMSDDVADMIISQCSDFIKDPENNLLIECFNEKIASFEGLSAESMISYAEQNKKAVLESVIPAYENLIATLQELKGTSTNQIGLCGFNEGKAYYELLCQMSTGSSKTIKEMKTALSNTLNSSILTMTTIQIQNPTITTQLNTFKFPKTDPYEILTYLKGAIKDDFPAINDVNCSVRYVHESMRDHLSPAMYLVPPIDCYTENYIYINNNPVYDMSEIFPTIAHEGYPGHLYQNVYFRSQNPNPVRNIINITGYDEGWATYVEAYSYSLAGLTKDLQNMLVANMIALHCLYSLSDIGIHYEGWTKSDTAEFWNVYGISSDIAEDIYYTILSEPGIYLPYSIGYIEIMELQTKAKNALGDKFTLMNFHEFLLKIGPCPYSVINAYMEKWLSSQK
ncbi:MAG: DUF885 domain-containing protein [Lachnospiraceae bacterium]|nr:DUF885 domain-containing protein [Lachnospiraceae bacterium]